MRNLMDKFRDWYLRNWESITWFLVGFMTLNAINHLARGQWEGAVLDMLIIFINIAFLRRPQ